jgi:hypothetical protein
MIINITYPKFKAFTTSSGSMQYASGYKVWAFAADQVPSLLTAVNTYSDPDCTVLNTWPVVLDSVGEASIYVNVDVKLAFASSTGDWSSPIWTIDNLSKQQNTTIVSGEATAGTTNNNYVCDVVPPFTSLPNNLTLVMTPDVDNTATLGVTTQTGSGINDLTFTGPYIGSTSGSVFTVEVMGVGVPVAVTIAENVAAGLVTAGNHYVKIVAVTATGDSLPSAASNVVNAAGARKIDVTGIPAISSLITGYKIYMTKAGGTVYYYVATVTATTYTINVADAGLVTEINVAQTADDWIRWRKDGGAWTDQVVITATAQSMIEGVSFAFAQKINHTVGDIWTVDVTTPARLNFCGLGNKLIYKNEAGFLVGLGGGDMQEDYPATLVYSLSQDCWILNNPSLPVLTSLIPSRYRKRVTANYTLLAADKGTEISCYGTFTVTLPDPATLPHTFYYVYNEGAGTITIDAGAFTIFGPGQSVAGASTFKLTPTGIMAVQLGTNGVDWHILTTSLPVGAAPGFTKNLVIQNNAVTPNTKIDIDADTVVVSDGTNYYTATSVNLTVDGGVVGANGIDAGALASPNWYYQYVIYNVNTLTVAGLMSLSATAPTMPSGYTFKKLVGAARYTGGQFRPFYQNGDDVYLNQVSVVATWAGSPYVLTSIADIVPAQAVAASFKLSGLGGGAASSYFFIAWTGAAAGELELGFGAVGVTYMMTFNDYRLNPAAPQTVYLMTTDGNVDLDVTGFKMRLS